MEVWGMIQFTILLSAFAIKQLTHKWKYIQRQEKASDEVFLIREIQTNVFFLFFIASICLSIKILLLNCLNGLKGKEKESHVSV